MSKRHNLFDDEVRLKLFEEVQQFWQENGALLTKAKSSFTNG